MDSQEFIRNEILILENVHGGEIERYRNQLRNTSLVVVIRIGRPANRYQSHDCAL